MLEHAVGEGVTVVGVSVTSIKYKVITGYLVTENKHQLRQVSIFIIFVVGYTVKMFFFFFSLAEISLIMLARCYMWL